MTKLDGVGNSDNFNYRGIPSARSREGVLHNCSKSLGDRLPACSVNKNKVLMLIKLW